RPDPRDRPGRHPAAGHLLRGGALPLRARRRIAVRDLCRHLLLAAEVDRPHVRREARQVALLGKHDLLQPHLLPDAFPRPCRDAAPDPRLRAAVCRLQPRRVDRRVRLRSVAAHLLLGRPEVHRARPGREGAGEPLGGRRHARVDTLAVAAAVPQLRDPTGGPIADKATRQVPVGLSNNAKTALVLASIAAAVFLPPTLKYRAFPY